MIGGVVGLLTRTPNWGFDMASPYPAVPRNLRNPTDSGTNGGMLAVTTIECFTIDKAPAPEAFIAIASSLPGSPA